MFCEKIEKFTTVTLTEVQPKNAGFSKFIVSKETRVLWCTIGDWELGTCLLQLVLYMYPINYYYKETIEMSMLHQTFCYASFPFGLVQNKQNG